MQNPTGYVHGVVNHFDSQPSKVISTMIKSKMDILDVSFCLGRVSVQMPRHPIQLERNGLGIKMSKKGPTQIHINTSKSYASILVKHRNIDFTVTNNVNITQGNFGDHHQDGIQFSPRHRLHSAHKRELGAPF